MKAQDILDEVMEEGMVDMVKHNEGMLTIFHREFFTTGKKEFLFQLNCKATDSCKTPKTALKKIQAFLDQGFELETVLKQSLRV